MALAAVHSKAIVLLLLIRCLIVTPIVGFFNCSVLCCALLCVHSSFAIISMGKRADCFALFVFLVSHDFCPLYGFKGLRAVCDCVNL